MGRTLCHNAECCFTVSRFVKIRAFLSGPLQGNPLYGLISKYSTKLKMFAKIDNLFKPEFLKMFNKFFLNQVVVKAQIYI